MIVHPLADEILEQLWYRKEEGVAVRSAGELGLEQPEAEVAREMERLGSEKLVKLSPGVELLPAGEVRARAIVRRHRLAELLFSEVIGAEMDEAEASACEFEHILSERVVDRVCTFLGHPPKCPHGLPIPQGDCCRKLERKVEPLIERLADLPLGGGGTIAFIAPTSSARIARLSNLGIAPGSEIRLMQRRPSFVVKCGQTSIAFEDEIAKEIFVRPVRQGGA